MLATVAVSNTLDVVNAPDTSSIAALLADDGGDGISLREAVFAANNTAGADAITFDPGVFAGGGTITLGGTALEIAGGLTIDASNLTGNVTVDADQQSRVINFTAGAGLTLRGLTITGGEASGNGGGILVSTGGALTLEQSSVDQNTAENGSGGGIFSGGAVTLIDSTVNGNTSFSNFVPTATRGGGIGTSGANVTLTGSTVSGNTVVNTSGAAYGGGISAGSGDVTLTGSTVSDNRITPGSLTPFSGGGGIETRQGNVTLTDSTVSGNENTLGDGDGGGIYTSVGGVTLLGSTVSGNRVTGPESQGGGIFTNRGEVTLTGSTISGNQSSADGGGIYSSTSIVLIQNSTITNNTAGGVGGGIGMNGTIGLPEELTILNSIVAGNSDNGTAPDLLAPASVLSFLTLGFSLIGDNTGTALTEAQTADTDGNLIGSAGGAGLIDPQIGPLADNGGPTLTHALLPASPAINAGDPAFAPNDFTPSLDFDQRGPGFDRVLFGQVDIGAFESPAFLPPQGLIVSTAADVVDEDFSIGKLSLREAIAFANASAGDDTITFDPAVFSSEAADIIRLSAELGELQITETLTIDALGLGVVISGDTAGNDTQAAGVTRLDVTPEASLTDNVRVLNFTAGSGDLTLRGLTISGGRATGFGEDGGGIRFGGLGLSGTLTLDQSNVSGNSTTGSFAEGGGIGAFSGNITLTNSTVSENQSSDDGGGLFSYSGEIEIANSTVSGNQTGDSGGGIGTITGEVTLLSSTVSGNAADNNGGGVSTNSGDVGLFSSTVADNQSTVGGGLFLLGSFGNPALTVASSIVAGNTAVSVAPDLQFDPNGVITIGASLIGDTSGSGVTAATGVGNLLNVDPLLGLLADNGGPTQTHALLVGSPAINTGSSVFATDQRGFDRSVGGDDIGAFERQLVESTTLVVSTISDLDDGLLGLGELSLREAIRLTNAIPGDDTITFDPSVFSTEQTILLASQLPTLVDDLTIVGPGADLLTLDAGDGADGVFGTGDGFRVFAIDSNVTLSGLTLTGGDATGLGGAILNQGNLTVEASLIAENAATSGGGISSSGALEVTGSAFVGNNASAAGGGINVSGANQATVIGSTFSANSAVEGGGIANGGSSVLEVVSSTLFGNFAGSGGGVFNSGVATLTNNIVANSLSGANLAGSFSGGFNLIEDGSGGLNAQDNLLNVDPLLGPLADNGGTTPTHALLVSSPAINTGDPSFDAAAIPFDQRGLTRVALSTVDIGAFELQETDLIVSTTDDVDDGNFTPGELSLREAISIANQRANADTITFDPAVFTGGGASLIRLSAALGELEITETLTIDAAALGVVITGDTADNDVLATGSFVTDVEASLSNNATSLDDNVRVLNFTADSGDLTLRGLTITGGNSTGGAAGGGVRFGGFDFSGTLTLDQSNVSGNQSSSSGGGIAASSGNVTLITSNASDNRSLSGGGGGGISTLVGEVTLLSSAVSGNESLSIGGGIATSSGAVTLAGSTVSGNRTTGALANGGGIATVSGSVTLTSSTVTKNQSSAEGGGVFVFNTGDNPSFTIENSIVAGNTAVTAAPDLQFDPDGVVDINFSLIGDTSGAGVTASTGTGNLLNVDPLLGPLADNGGPTLPNGAAIPTHALLLGSPAIDAADPNFDTAATPFDQRGLPREALGAVDIGAFELQEITLVVSTTDDADDGNLIPGELSLREAIALANAAEGADTITFDPTVFTGGTASLIRLDSTALQITETLTIDADGLEVVITGDIAGDDTLVAGSFVTDLDASLSNDPTSLGDNTAVLNFSADIGDLTLRGLTITGGNAAAGAGVNFDAFDGTLTLDQSTVSGNQGGGIAAGFGEVTLAGSAVNGNQGRGIFTGFGDVTLNSSTVSGNTSSDAGGGIGTSFGAVTLTDSTVSGNTSGDAGGGIGTSFGAVTLTGSIVSGNSVTSLNGAGGGIYTFGGPVTLTGSTVSGNSVVGAGSTGGGIATGGDGAVTLTGSTVSGNSITGDLFVFGDGESFVPGGGGIATEYGAVTLAGSTISGNSTAGTSSNGGGLFTISGTVILTSSTVSGNSTTAASANGGGINNRLGNTTLIDSTVTGNQSAAAGGGLFIDNSLRNPGLTIENSIIAGNTAVGAFTDLQFDPNGAVNIAFSLIGVADSGLNLAQQAIITDPANNNLFGSVATPLDPLLGPLTDNGGPTLPNGAAVLTHALLPGSPAIDAGASTLATDQRGFDRNLGGGVDIGAFEVQPEPDFLAGDFNRDSFVNAADFVVFRDTLGSSVPNDGDAADGNSNGIIDTADFDVFITNFGASDVPVVSSPAAAPASNPAVIVEAVAAESPAAPTAQVSADATGTDTNDDLLLLALAESSAEQPAAAETSTLDASTFDEAFASEEDETEEILALVLSEL